MSEEEEEKLRAFINRPGADAELMRPNNPEYGVSRYACATVDEDTVLLAIELVLDPQNPSAQHIRLLLSREDCSRLARSLDILSQTPHVLPPGKPS